MAAALLVGCGVGVDDPEGQAALGPTFAHQEQGLGTAQIDTAVLPEQNAGQKTPTLAPPGGPSTAPQDPVPAIESLLQPVAEPLPGGPLGTDCGPRPGR